MVPARSPTRGIAFDSSDQVRMRHNRHPMTASTSLQLPAAGPADLGAIRAFVRDAATARGMAAAEIQDLVLVVDELATNVMRHGYQGRPGPIEVVVGGDATEVQLTLRDQAPMFDPTTQPMPDLEMPLEQRPAGKMGIHLTRLCMDRMEHRALPGGGNELDVALRLAAKGDDGDADHD